MTSKVEDQVIDSQVDVLGKLLDSLLLVTAVFLSVASVISIIISDFLDVFGLSGTLLFTLLVASLWAAALYKQIPFKVRASFFLAVIYSLTILTTFSAGLTITTRVLMLLATILGFILLGFRVGAALLFLSGLLMFVFGLAAANGLYVAEGEISSQGVVSVFLVTLITLFYSTYKLQIFSKEVGQKQKSFRAELNFSKENLEEEVLRQTHALTIASDISRQLLAIYNQQDVLGSVVSSLSKAFNYYHVHAYLIEDEKDTLRMTAGSGEIGTALFTQEHRIPIGKGLVGQAALMNITIYVPDVSKDDNWLPNPLLPDTKSEIVVPISFGGKVLGVLDVQDNRLSGLMQEDVNILETVGIELGVALRNSEIYQISKGRASRKIVLNEISRRIRQTETVEEAVRVATEGLGTHFDLSKTAALVDMGRLSDIVSKSVQEVADV